MVHQPNAAPEDALPFEIIPEIGGNPLFSPKYYPKRLNRVGDKELEKEKGPHGGQEISIKKMKNGKYSVTGNVLYPHTDDVVNLHTQCDPVILISPVYPESGEEVIIKNAEIGDKQGWDPHENEWLFEYTIEALATGRDQFDQSTTNIVVSGILASQDTAPDGAERQEETDG